MYWAFNKHRQVQIPNMCKGRFWYNRTVDLIPDDGKKIICLFKKEGVKPQSSCGRDWVNWGGHRENGEGKWGKWSGLFDMWDFVCRGFLLLDFLLLDFLLLDCLLRGLFVTRIVCRVKIRNDVI